MRTAEPETGGERPMILIVGENPIFALADADALEDGGFDEPERKTDSLPAGSPAR